MKRDRKAAIQKQVAELKKHFGFGALTEKDFYRICRSERIILINDKDTCERMEKIKPLLGLYIRRKDRVYIWLHSFYENTVDLFTAAHELGHHFLGHRAVSFREKNFRAKSDSQENEADYFAESLCSETGEAV